MEVYTEDDARVTSSILLSKMRALNYLGGNKNVYELLGSRVQTVVYLDVVPDNDELMVLYKYISEEAANSLLTVIPTPCIEYFIIKVLVDNEIDFGFKYPWLSTVLKNVLSCKTIRRPLPPRSIGYRKSFNSFEKQCKLVLANCSDALDNSNTAAPNVSLSKLQDSWYLTDSDNMSMFTKSALLWLKLPCIVVKEGKPEVDMDLVPAYLLQYRKWLYSNCKVKLPDNWWM